MTKKNSSNSVGSTTSTTNTTPSKTQVPVPGSSPLTANQNNDNSLEDSIKCKKSLNGPSSAPNVTKTDCRDLPKAMVKPNVLTHVIEGFVIQEASEPFPVTRQRYSEKENDEPPKKKFATEACESPKLNGESSAVICANTVTAAQLPTDVVSCEQCGKPEQRQKLKRKRFCSLNCARTSKSASTENVQAPNGDDIKIQAPATPTQQSKVEENGGSNAKLQPVEEHVMLKWSVAQVCEFIKNLPGCTDYAEDFALQEIDGQALLLLKENHLVSAMGMKLGPALKIVNKIESMRVATDAEQHESTPATPQ